MRFGKTCGCRIAAGTELESHHYPNHRLGWFDWDSDAALSPEQDKC